MVADLVTDVLILYASRGISLCNAIALSELLTANHFSPLKSSKKKTDRHFFLANVRAMPMYQCGKANLNLLNQFKSIQAISLQNIRL